MYRVLGDQQVKHEIDTQQTFEALRDCEGQLRTYAGGMHWKQVGDADYLYKTRGGSGNAKSIGRRSAETESVYSAFTQRKAVLVDRLRGLRATLDTRIAVAKALRIGTAPNLLGEICSRLAKSDLLGKNIVVIGTNALHAYEALAGVRFDPEMMATEDVDLLWNVKAKLSVAAHGVHTQGLLGLLKTIDASFSLHSRQSFRAINRTGYLVDLIKHVPRPLWKEEPEQLGGPDDFLATGIHDMDWLLSAPRIRATVLALSGRPFEMVVPDPRAYMLYKAWLSKEPTRNALKKGRDARQAEAVHALLVERLPQFSLAREHMRSFPVRVFDSSTDQLRKSRVGPR